jgi:hypothetical protein
MCINEYNIPSCLFNSSYSRNNKHTSIFFKPIDKRSYKWNFVTTIVTPTSYQAKITKPKYDLTSNHNSSSMQNSCCDAIKRCHIQTPDMSLCEKKAIHQNKLIAQKYITAKESHWKESMSACKLSKPTFPLIKYKPTLSSNKIKKIQNIQETPTQIFINARNALQFAMKYKNSKLSFKRNNIQQATPTYFKPPTPTQILVTPNKISRKYFTKLNIERSKINYFFENAQLTPWNNEAFESHI